MPDKRLQSKEIPLTGKLVTSEDPAVIGENFQKLINMRYTQTSIEGIGGHSKINTAVIPNPKVRSGFFFDKEDESHTIVEAYNSGLTASKIYQNNTAIPNTGDFDATELYTPLSGTGRFSSAPNGYLAYANGAETCIYGGNESDIGGFINYDPSGSFTRDQTEQVLDTVASGSGHVATLKRVTESTADDVLLLHCENNDTDSSPSSNTLTDTNVTYNASAKKWGSYGAILNGTNANFVCPTSSDFDFSGADATWTVDFWGTVDSLSSLNPIYYKQTDATNYFGIFITTGGAVQVSHFDTGAETLNATAGFYSSAGVITAGTQYHIEINRNASYWYIFVDGALVGIMADTQDVGTESGDVLIGSDGTFYYDGDIDEYRVSSIATHTQNFEVPSDAYGDGYVTYLYAGSIMPVSQFKFYVETANTAAATATVEYWDGSAFAPVNTFVDGTLSGGVSLAQTGTMTFESTANTASLKDLNGLLLYWYRVKISNADNDTAVYHVTCKVPFQPIKDIWDGMPTTILSCLKFTTKYEDFTTSVFESDYLSTSGSTYVDLTGLTSSQSIIVGFDERQLGMRFNIIGGEENTTANTVASVDYWDGSDWASVGDIFDGTSKDGISFGQAGLITWGQVDAGVEFKTEFTGALAGTPILYYYRVSFDKTLSEGRVDQVTGVSAQKTIGNYKFPLNAMNRLWLFSDQNDKKNKSICTAENSTTTLNGEDSIELYWGDEKELMASAWLYSQYGASVYSILVVFKKNETWVLIGNDPENWAQYRISSSVGCVAPETVKVIEMPMSESKGVNRSSIVIFQAADGIYMTDGRPPVLISGELDIFDKRKANITNIYESFSFVNIEKQEYHWCFTDTTHTDKEYVFDYNKRKWFAIERPSPLQYGLEVATTDGTTHTYGFIDSYMLRLEHTNAFDSAGIPQTFQFGDIALAQNSVTKETTACYHNLTTATKTSTSDITATHYGDSATTGNEFTLEPRKTGYRTITTSKHKDLGSHIFHSWKFTTTTDDETVGFEPLFFSCLYQIDRLHKRDYRKGL